MSKRKCPTHICDASCCYNIPLDKMELERFSKDIVNPVIETYPIGRGVLAITNEDPDKNKCPFLRKDYRCNIYENRPEVCRLYGEIDELPCPYYRKCQHEET